MCGTYGETEACREILLGSSNSSVVEDSGTKLFIKHLKVDEGIMNRAPVCCDITVDEFQEYWKRAKEKTSSSPSGRHFSQWKAIAKDRGLSNIMTTMVTIPLVTGYSPERWRYRLERSLQKKGKGLKANELRTIVLMEADLNMALKTVFGFRMMRNEEFSSEYPDSQFGSKRGSRAIEAVRLKRACYDNTRFMRDSSVCFW